MDTSVQSEEHNWIHVITTQWNIEKWDWFQGKVYSAGLLYIKIIFAIESFRIII